MSEKIAFSVSLVKKLLVQSDFHELAFGIMYICMHSVAKTGCHN